MEVFLHWIETLLQETSGSWSGYITLFGVSGLLGITHTFGPGHGKSLLLGVLVADSRRVGHALRMALVIGLTHMADVILLSGVSIFLVSTIPIGTYSQVIGTVSGLGILLLGLYRVYTVIKGPSNVQTPSTHAQSKASSGNHEMENYMTAFLYSLAPCPAAWVLFMACLGIGEAITGVFLLLGFTLGLLITIGGIALSIVYSLNWSESFLPDKALRYISLATGVVISILGAWLLIEGTHVHEPSPLNSSGD